MSSLILWNVAWSAALAVVVFCLGRLPALQRRPALMHLLWFGVLLRLVVPAVISVPVLPDTTATVRVEADFTNAVPQNVSVEIVPVAAAPVSLEPTERIEPPAESGMPPLTLSGVLMAVSLTGTAVLLIVSAVRCLRLRRLTSSSCAAPPWLDDLAAQLAGAMPLSRVPRLRIVDGLATPSLWGFGRRTTILLPRHLVDAFDGEQWSCILAHELAHVVRGDLWFNLAAAGVLHIFWWNPVAWWAFREMRAAQEASCDALALSRRAPSRRRYAETLLQVVDSWTRPSLIQPHVLLGFGTRSVLTRRFEMIADSSVRPRVAGVAMLCLAAFGLTFLCLPGRGRQIAGAAQNANNANDDKERPAVAAEVPFEILYAIPDGKVLKRVAFPFSEEARKRYEASANPEQKKAIPQGPSGKIWKTDGKKIELARSVFGDAGIHLHLLVEFLLGVKMCELEGDAKLWTKLVVGDFVIRNGATQEELVEDLDRILNSELGLNTTLAFEEVERDVFVATGKFVAKPSGPPGQFPGHPKLYQIYGRQQQPHPQDGIGTFEDFLKIVSLRTGRRIVNEAKDTPTGMVHWALSYDSLDKTVWDTIPPKSFSTNSDLVLQRVTEQTGLRFQKAKRTVRVLSLKPKITTSETPANPIVNSSRVAVVNAEEAKKQTDVLLKYDDGKPDGKKSIAGTGEMIRFVAPDANHKLKSLRLHCARYGTPKAPNEDVDVSIVSDDEETVLHTELVPYSRFKRGDSRWTTIEFKAPVNVPEKFWIVVDFNAEQTKGVYLSFDTSTGGKHSKTGVPGGESKPVATGGDWMIQAVLTNGK